MQRHAGPVEMSMGTTMRADRAPANPSAPDPTVHTHDPTPPRPRPHPRHQARRRARLHPPACLDERLGARITDRVSLR